MPLTFEAEITPGMSTAEVVELARLAEQAGFDRLGVSDVVLWHDCFVLLGLISARTSRIALGPMVTNPYSRHPVHLAGAMAALQDASGGRMFLGQTITLHGARLVGPCAPVPISIGTRSPQVMRLAGELADVALVGGRPVRRGGTSTTTGTTTPSSTGSSTRTPCDGSRWPAPPTSAWSWPARSWPSATTGPA